MRLDKLDWKDIWDSFNDWFQEDRSVICKHCDNRERNDPDWDEQAKAIQRIVNAKLKNRK